MTDWCGTLTGARHHRNLGQPLCHECQTHLRQRRGNASGLTPSGRPGKAFREAQR